MRKIFYFLLIFTIISCSKPSDCIESTGAMITKIVEVPSFSKIKYYRGIAVVLTEGANQKVEIQTGENLMSDISVAIEGNMLVIKDNTSCNWVREYGQTTVYITAPNITDIICKSEKSITSNGILTYPNLRLESIDISDGAGTGDFYMQINNNQLVIENKNQSNFYISGQTNSFLSSIYEGSGRIEAPNFLAQNINVFHRGSNDMILNPQAKIEGNIYSTGDVVCKNHPPIVNVTAYYHGRLIFN